MSKLFCHQLVYFIVFDVHNEELTDMSSSPNIIRVIEKNEMGGACSTYGGEERCIQCFGVET
jgi:hypothetical protein